MGCHGGRLCVLGAAVYNLAVRNPAKKVPLVLLEDAPTEPKPDPRQASDDWPDLNVLDGRLFEQLASGGLGRSLAVTHPAAGQVPIRRLIQVGWILGPEQEHSVPRVEEEDACDLPTDREMCGHRADFVGAPTASQRGRQTGWVPTTSPSIKRPRARRRRPSKHSVLNAPAAAL
jgi:hypothetical protein